MKIMDSLSQIIARSDQATNEHKSYALERFEIRLIADGKLVNLADFAQSSRLNATDPKGDTPLQLAARIGNLALCDLFIRSGADPWLLNHDRQTPADVASAEGHGFAAQLLSSLVARSLEPARVVGREKSPELEIATAGIETVTGHNIKVVQQVEPDNATDDLDNLLSTSAAWSGWR
jgi:RNA polymerase primary sigma factor